MKKIVIKNLDKKLAKIDCKLPLQFKKRSRMFTNSTGSCGFNPETGEGHSYNWYSLTKVINGKLVLNNYSYSNQTIKHVSKIRCLFRLLKVKFVEIPAPQGLQDLKLARDQIALNYGKAVIAEKYARIKSPWKVENALKTIETARSLGMTFSPTDLKNAVKCAEVLRRQRLDRLRERRTRLIQYKQALEARTVAKPELRVVS